MKQLSEDQAVLHDIKQLPDLAGVPDEELLWLIQRAECRWFDEGSELFTPGAPIDIMYILLEGRFDLRVEQNGQYRTIGYFEKHEVTGALPYSRGTTATGRSRALKDSHVVMLSKDHFPEMIRTQHELTKALVHVMSSRIRKFTKRQQQDDKMMALGKLSAGLAHELNNPAAAVIRSARELKKHLGFMPEGFKRVIQIQTTEKDVDAINAILFERLQNVAELSLGLMEKAEREDELLDWMEDFGMDDVEAIAEILAEYGFKIEDLHKVSSLLREEDVFPVLNWFAQVLITEKLVGEIDDASQRISDLVGSVKGYTHMDQAPERKTADIRTGIRNTLTMLQHKIKKNEIEVVERFDEEIPNPSIFVSEMNQVWTNVIDNAIDAMKESEKRQLEVRTGKDGDCIVIDIQDTGSGIPDEVVDRIFDPFFTTKDVGEGTGLGLDVVQQIINQHNGKIDVESGPQGTKFSISIPIS